VCKDWHNGITTKPAVPLLIKSLPGLLKNCKSWDGYFFYKNKAEDIEGIAKLREKADFFGD
jgi:hypothetical protein